MPIFPSARRAALLPARLPPWVLVLVIGVLQRAWLLHHLAPAYAAFMATRVTPIAMQFYPVSVYRDHFWAGLWLLQQTPPLIHVVMKLALLAGAWPVGVTEILCGLGGACTIATACLLQPLLRRVTGSLAASLVLALWFLLSTDAVILEYAYFGEVFYELAAMLAVLGMAVALSGRPVTARRAALAGLAAALGALTRSSLSYVALAALPFLPRRRAVWAAYVAPVLLLQGGWALKNFAVYGSFSAETSTWAGFSAAKSITLAGQFPAMAADILAAPASAYPPWFTQYLRRTNRTLFAAIPDADMPAPVAAEDAALARRLEVPPRLNAVSMRLASGQFRRAALRYALAHPADFGARLAQSYETFWQRIGDFGAVIPGLLYVTPRGRPITALAARGFGEHVFITTRCGTGLELFSPCVPEGRKARLGTLSLAPLDTAAIIAVHLLFPPLALRDLRRRMRGQSPCLCRDIWLCAALAIFGIVVFNGVELGENMRFRMAVEPELIVLTAGCFAALAREITAAARALRQGRRK